MYLYGASGHAMVIMDILNACGIELEGLVDDNPALDELQGVPVHHAPIPGAEYLISIGNNAVRKKVAEKLAGSFTKALVHPTALVSPRASVGEGSVVMQGAIIQSCASIGRHCIINTAASLDHECRVADFVHISPHATLCGNVQVGEGSWIGAGATIIQGIRIGQWSLIAAGATITHDVPDCVLVAGTPGRIIKQLSA